MKTIKLIWILFVLTYLKVLAQNQSPIVDSVRFIQREDGSLKVDVYYNVNDAEGNIMTVAMKASSDNGATWNYSCNNITGDVGAGITSGTNKHIVWDFAAEHPQTFGDQFRIKIIADDEQIMNIPCPGISTVTYAGKTYNTVQIGAQCWLKENLDVGTMIDSLQRQTNNVIIEKYCYHDSTINCNTYGGLYQWDEAMQYVSNEGTQGICPSGWHIPTYSELQTLRNSVNGDGNALKAIGQGSGSGAGTNISGFSGMLGGYSNTQSIFRNLGVGYYLWSSTYYNPFESYRLWLYDIGSNIFFDHENIRFGKNVRCLKD